jgi:ABC-type glycerol-3-phosphate transport system permease component
MRRRRVRRWVLFAILVPVTCAMVFPFYWTVIAALKSKTEILTSPPTFVPVAPTLENFRVVLVDKSFPKYFVNSVLVGATASAVGLLLSSLAAYALARFSFRGRNLLGMFSLFTQMFPLAVLIVPLFILWRTLSLTNTHPGLIGSYIAITLPLGLWLLRAYYIGIPAEIEDAARVDGCSYLGVFWHVILPLSVPGLVSVFIYTITVCWQEYLFAVTFISSDDLKTLPVMLNSFTSQHGTDWGGLMAAAVLMSVPVAIVYLLLQRYFLEGLTAGSVKG